MRLLHYSLAGIFASCLLALGVSAQAQVDNTEMIEVAISGKGSLPFPQDFKVRVKESIPSEFTLERDGIAQKYRYKITAKKTPESVLNALPRKLNNSISVELTIEQSEGNQSWVERGHYETHIEENTVAMIHSGDGAQNFSVQLIPRIVSASEHAATSIKVSVAK